MLLENLAYLFSILACISGTYLFYKLEYTGKYETYFLIAGLVFWAISLVFMACASATSKPDVAAHLLDVRFVLFVVVCFPPPLIGIACGHLHKWISNRAKKSGN